MEIGTRSTDTFSKYKGRKANEVLPSDLRLAVEMGVDPQEWLNQRVSDEGLELPSVSYRNGNYGRCDNELNPDKKIPDALFNFELILSGRKFQVCIDTLIRIKDTEDLAQYSDGQLKDALQQCAAYRVTCYCAYIAAHREHRRWKTSNEIWMSEKREEARTQMRADRIADKNAMLRKEIGQISAQEIEDWIISKYKGEYKQNIERESEWEENADIYLELRDTLKDRAMHLQTLLKRVNDHTENMMSNGN